MSRRSAILRGRFMVKASDYNNVAFYALSRAARLIDHTTILRFITQRVENVISWFHTGKNVDQGLLIYAHWERDQIELVFGCSSSRNIRAGDLPNCLRVYALHVLLGVCNWSLAFFPARSYIIQGAERERERELERKS